jgi:hypothetical protein
MPSKEAISAKLATLERGWVKNEGQWDERALFSAPGYFGTTWIAKDGQLVHTAVKGKESWVISERWVDGKVQTVKGEEELQTKVSYFVGNDPSKHRSNLPTYRYVSLGEVWSGVEVKLKATQKTVEKLFYIKPGADPSKIVVEVDGAEGLRLSKDGEIIIQTGLGDLKLSKPIAWQEKDGKKLPVEVSYKLLGKNRYSFVVAKADPSLPIVIDPILQSTYLGGGGSDTVYALAIHPTTGEVYVAGNTSSNDFPGTSGRPSTRSDQDAFVAKLSADLKTLYQVTYLGGGGTEYANALAIHPQTGEVYVAGRTSSSHTSTNPFPGISSDSAQAIYRGSGDGFVARLSADLTQIIKSTYLGGSGSDSVRALAIHPTTGEVYVAGQTSSNNFPKASDGSDGAQASYGGGSYDGFVAKLSADLTQIIKSTYLGGSGDDFAKALAISSTGDVYVAGDTTSNDFPGTTGGAQASCGGSGCSSSNQDAFVARLNKELTQILKSTFLGGSNTEYARALAIHPITGEVYVAGETSSSHTSTTPFPGTSGGAQETHGGGSYDAFVARLSADLTQILQSTYLGGSGSDKLAGGTYDPASALAIHPKTGEVYVAGETSSDTGFPGISSDSAQPINKGNGDAFVARLSINLTNGPILSISPTPTNGTITSNPSGISCGSGGSMCSADFPSGTLVALTATPDPGYVFVGWGDGCASCLDNPTCTIPIDANTTCSANFAVSGGGGSGGGSVYTLSISLPPTNGTITSTPAGISCGSGGSACSANFAEGTLVTLTATPDPGYVFVGWGDGCASCLDNPTCIIPMSANTTCSANFAVSSGGGSGGGSGSDSGSGSGGSGTGGSGSGSGGGSGSDTGSGSGSSGGSGSGTGGSSGGSGAGSGGSGIGLGSGGTGGGGGGCSMTGSASSMAGLWNILVWLSVPAFALARRIRRK